MELNVSCLTEFEPPEDFFVFIGWKHLVINDEAYEPGNFCLNNTRLLRFCFEF